MKHQLQPVTPLHHMDYNMLIANSTTIKYLANQIVLQGPTTAPSCTKLGINNIEHHPHTLLSSGYDSDIN